MSLYVNIILLICVSILSIFNILFPLVLCVDSLTVLWDPSNCQVCNRLIETHFSQDLPKEVRREASSTIRKWVEEFRKNADAGPFLIDEELRATLFPNTAKRFVFNPQVHVGGGIVMLMLFLVIILPLPILIVICL